MVLEQDVEAADHLSLRVTPGRRDCTRVDAQINAVNVVVPELRLVLVKLGFCFVLDLKPEREEDLGKRIEQLLI